MKKILIVVDMQNDFIDGSLGTPEAEAIVDNVIAKINTYTKDCVYATRDTHQDNYLQTQEGENLPIVHCIEGTYGWQLNERVQAALGSAVVMNKPSFGSWELADMMVMEFAGLPTEECEIEIIGLCTDICVVSIYFLFDGNFSVVSEQRQYVVFGADFDAFENGHRGFGGARLAHCHRRVGKNQSVTREFHVFPLLFVDKKSTSVFFGIQSHFTISVRFWQAKIFFELKFGK